MLEIICSFYFDSKTVDIRALNRLFSKTVDLAIFSGSDGMLSFQHGDCYIYIYRR